MWIGNLRRNFLILYMAWVVLPRHISNYIARRHILPYTPPVPSYIITNAVIINKQNTPLYVLLVN